MTRRAWCSVANTVADIQIIDFIGDDDGLAGAFGYPGGLTAGAFIDALRALPASVTTLHVHLNSPGGDDAAALAIANALRDQQTSKGRTVETFIDGIAAAAASVIAMAGSKVHIADNALVMVRNPWSYALGNAGEMRKVADILDTMRVQIVNTYRWHSPLEASALEALMDAETWMDADEALKSGLATDKVEGLPKTIPSRAVATITRRAVAAARLSVPVVVAARLEPFLAPPPAAALDVIAACNAAQSPEEVLGLLERAATMATVTAHLADVTRRKEQARDRALHIRALCRATHWEDAAELFVNGGFTVQDVMVLLTSLTAKMDTVEIDTSLDPDGDPRKKQTIDRAAVYAAHNRPVGRPS